MLSKGRTIRKVMGEKGRGRGGGGGGEEFWFAVTFLDINWNFSYPVQEFVFRFI